MSKADEFENAIAGQYLKGDLGEIAKFLDDKGIDLSVVGKARLYQQGYKDEDGEGQVQDLFSVELAPAWADGPQWPVVQPAKPVKVARVKARKLDAGVETVLFLPDAQCGFFRTESGELIPTHDPQAMQLTVQVAAYVRPHRIVLLGDNADLPEWSLKFARTPTMAATTNETIGTLYEWMSQLRAVCPEAKIDWIEGNHEARLPKLLAANAAAAFGVRQANEKWPVLSMPFLCRLDELDIGWVPGYPAGALWMRDDIKAIHGKRLSAQRASKDPLVASQFFGHLHRLEVQSRTHTISRNEYRKTLHVSCGTLARIDGAVPSFGSGVDDSGLPVTGNDAEDWVQSVVIAEFEREGHEPPSIELVPFSNGTCRLRGTTLSVA